MKNVEGANLLLDRLRLIRGFEMILIDPRLSPFVTIQANLAGFRIGRPDLKGVSGFFLEVKMIWRSLNRFTTDSV